MEAGGVAMELIETVMIRPFTMLRLSKLDLIELIVVSSPLQRQTAIHSPFIRNMKQPFSIEAANSSKISAKFSSSLCWNLLIEDSFLSLLSGSFAETDRGCSMSVELILFMER